MVLAVKGMFKHILLVALLIFHTSWGAVMAAQMQTAHFKMGTPDNSMPSAPKVATIDNADSKPCPHHSNSMQITPSQQASNSMTHCNDCANCDCVNVLSSLPQFSALIDNIQIDSSNALPFIAAVFPDSPPSFILRPPIS